MPSSSIFWSPAPYHIISYGTLLGSEMFQSFIAGIIAFRALPRPQFATLQSALFPIYFGMQTALPLLMALTYPAERTAIGMSQSSISGVLEEGHRLHVATPLFLTLLCGAANMLFIGPATTKCMKERKHQETRDGKKSYDSGPHSEAMQNLNKKFGILHGISSSVNLVGCIATVWYGFYLAERML
ncbi:hypothetical protein LTS08_008053 [Lithohypha guttulata]|uniref:TMEM205-like domain-containing protein n=1 Tax=Lithohypha guttulata TaxID=1690604 RepID=A0AAN7TE07_9EURO|nr:hypothetical protein LTR51_004592 [Lithohypha guttulata]KAK5091199.1 hypothetical protein LTR05_001379 [Lithohypha guttulata]KAK5095659.1 hypothetical protein LTS08_008053 [Lithohypha guttulata]